MSDLSLKLWYEYEEGDEKIPQSVHQLVKVLSDEQTAQQTSNLRNLRYYMNSTTVALPMASSTTIDAADKEKDRLKYLNLNVIKSCIDTLVAKIAKNKIRPRFLTDGGSWKKQQEAMKLEKFVNGVLYQNKVHKLGPRVLKDAGICGDGFASVSHLGDEIIIEKCISDEFIVDANESVYGDTRTLYRRKYESKQTLLDLEKDEKKKELIRKTQTVVRPGSRAQSDSVLVIYAWRLPSQKGADDGRYVRALENCVLEDNQYKRMRFPFARIKYTENPIGFFSSGIAEELSGIQTEINRLLNHIRICTLLVSRPWVLIEKSSGVNKSQMTNRVGGEVEYSTTPPIFVTPPTVGQEIFTQLENLYRKAYEIVGISQLSSSSKNPLGANASGRALREFNDIETERFSQTGFAYEDFHIELAELIIDEAKEMKSKGINVSAKAFSRREGLEKINWSEIDLDADDYVMQIFPASALPKDPGARLETVQEMMAAGYVDTETGFDLLDFPDLDRQSMLVNAPIRLIRKSIEKMLDTGKYVSPDPYWNLQKCLQIAQLYYNRCQLMDFEESKLQLLTQFMDDVNSQMQPQTPPPAPVPPGGPMIQPPGAEPALPPNLPQEIPVA